MGCSFLFCKFLCNECKLFKISRFLNLPYLLHCTSYRDKMFLIKCLQKMVYTIFISLSVFKKMAVEFRISTKQVLHSKLITIISKMWRLKIFFINKVVPYKCLYNCRYIKIFVKPAHFRENGGQFWGKHCNHSICLYFSHNINLFWKYYIISFKRHSHKSRIC